MAERLPHSLKLRLYQRDGGCTNPEGCQVTNIDMLTIDHFTPRCIGKLLGWRQRKINATTNLQLLCEEHHIQKDRTTPAVKQQMLFQLKGGTINFGEHI